MKTIVRELEEGETIPTGYGVAWWDGLRRIIICYPFPLNYILGFLRKVWQWIRYSYIKNDFDIKLHEAELRGYQRGISDMEQRAKKLLQEKSK